jgi:rubrerythrin
MPGLDFSADEILALAVQIERNGAKFYRQAAQQFPGARAFLTKLAEMEDVHEKTFARMRTELTARETELPASDPDGEMEQFAAVLANGKIFPVAKSSAEALRPGATLDDVLLWAIDREKDSVVFYIGMKEMVPPAFGRDRIDLIVKEEMNHIAWISKELGKAG